MDDRFVQKTQSGEETLSNCDAGVLRRVQLEQKIHVVQEGKIAVRIQWTKRETAYSIVFPAQLNRNLICPKSETARWIAICSATPFWTADFAAQQKERRHILKLQASILCGLTRVVCEISRV